MIEGVTVNALVAATVPSEDVLAAIEYEPRGVPEGTVIVQVNVPSGATVTAGAQFSAVPPKYGVTASPVRKPVPDMATELPTFPEEGVKVRIGSGVNDEVEVTVLVPSAAVSV